MTDKQIGLSRPVEGLCRRLTAIVRIERGKDQLAQVLLVHRTDRVGATLQIAPNGPDDAKNMLIDVVGEYGLEDHRLVLGCRGKDRRRSPDDGVGDGGLGWLHEEIR